MWSPAKPCMLAAASLQSLLVCLAQDKLKAGDVLALPKELQAVIIGLTHRDPRSRFTAEKALHLLTQKPAGGSFPGQVSRTISLEMDSAKY